MSDQEPIQEPAPGPVWWFSTHPRSGIPAYTKSQTWHEARSALGGNPVRVTDPDTLASLESQDQ
jgi:hypothetical protein